MSPEGHALSVAGEETIDGIDRLGAPPEGRRRGPVKKPLDVGTLASASRRKKQILLPIHAGTKAGRCASRLAVIELKCDWRRRTGWKELLAAREKNPAEILWGGYRSKR